jgi:hypothetical protein
MLMGTSLILIAGMNILLRTQPRLVEVGTNRTSVRPSITTATTIIITIRAEALAMIASTGMAIQIMGIGLMEILTIQAPEMEPINAILG